MLSTPHQLRRVDLLSVEPGLVIGVRVGNQGPTALERVAEAAPLVALVHPSLLDAVVRPVLRVCSWVVDAFDHLIPPPCISQRVLAT